MPVHTQKPDASCLSFHGNSHTGRQFIQKDSDTNVRQVMRNEPKAPAFTSLWISERTYHIRIRNIPYIPDGLRTHSLPTTEFCKTAATATTLPSETTMSRAFRRVVAALFLCTEKGRCHHFYLFFTPERPKEGEDTWGGGQPHTGKRWRVRTRRTREPDRQNYSYIQTKPQLQPSGTIVSSWRNSSFNPMKL